MMSSLRNHLPHIILLLGIVSYILYFSLFTINRQQKLYAHYFDLGIMHQAVYNTYKGLQTGDFSRIFEITNPHSTADQIKRMSVHNDVTLGLIAPLYFIYSGPETLLILQSIIMGFGALYIYFIAIEIIPTSRKRKWFALLFAYSYLLYPALQKANNFDFHTVTFATTFLLAMYYYWLKKKHGWSIFFAVMSVLTKEQVGLAVATFGVYSLWKRTSVASSYISKYYSLTLIILGLLWTSVSMIYIIPYFRGGEHFGTKYFTYLKEDPMQIFPVIFRYETWHYIFILLAPVGFFALVSLPHLLIIAPEFAINILSSNGNMRNIYFHYNAVLTPFIFIASIYGVKRLLNFKFPISKENILLTYLATTTIIFSLYMSPLPWGKDKDTFPWKAAPEKVQDVLLWQEYLKDDQIKVSATGHLAPHFTSRQYYYDFSWKYEYADYVVIDTGEVDRGFMRHLTEPAYKDLQKDWRYIRIYEHNGIEVYKKL